MATSSPSVVPNMGVFDIISTAFDVVKNDLRIPGLQVIVGALSLIPLLGPLLSVAVTGIAMQFADETIGSSPPQNSIGIRLLYSILTWIVVVILISIGLVVFILPGIYLAFKFYLAIPAIWLGDEGPLEALSDSWERTDGNLLTIFGVGVVFFLITMVLFIPLMMVALGGAAVSSAAEAGGAGILLASPILIAGTIAIAITIGSVSVASQTVMYRTFGQANTGQGGNSLDDSTQF